ncbi:hypothetical protein DH2020_014281 [Rehmannia glutinosa]|uniref:Major facilitator superfamily (MFS) profile domain-containing protein n=1 Tax=Rehmannia glutinosa TaxID=99300 RepID=A0ABR0WXD3_REHGL
MDEFLRKFFYTVYLNKNRAKENNYCKYNNQGLAAFTSSLYLSGLVASIVASAVTKKHGRRWSIICGGISFLIGAVLNASAVNLSMLLLGRIMLGVGIGFGNQIAFRFKDFQSTRKVEKCSKKIRGTKNADAEFEDIVDASTLAKAVKHPFREILKRRNRPQLVMAIFMPMFQILTGINAILFYAPVLFGSMGFKGNASLYSSALTGAVLALSTLVSMGVVDRWGRRVLLISGGIQMILCQITAATILGLKFGNDKELSKGFSITVVTTICLFVAAFGWSWGPLGWTVPSEIFPLQTRSAAQSITVAVNLLFTFIIAQSFLSLLCALKFGFFLFFSGWIVIMTIFVYVFLPETKGVPLEEMVHLWEKHWFWKKFVAD